LSQSQKSPNRCLEREIAILTPSKYQSKSKRASPSRTVEKQRKIIRHQGSHGRFVTAEPPRTNDKYTKSHKRAACQVLAAHAQSSDEKELETHGEPVPSDHFAGRAMRRPSSTPGRPRRMRCCQNHPSGRQRGGPYARYLCIEKDRPRQSFINPRQFGRASCGTVPRPFPIVEGRGAN